MGALLMLALLAAAASTKRARSSSDESEAERIVRESREIIDGARDTYSDDGDEP